MVDPASRYGGTLLILRARTRRPPREVTARDVIRGFKRMCNLVAGAAAISFYTRRIVECDLVWGGVLMWFW